MTAREIELLEQSLLALGRRQQPLEILEWGCGGSTLHFTEFLRRHDIGYHWSSVEHNREWCDKVRQQTQHDPHVEIHLFEYDHTAAQPDAEHMAVYVNFPATLGTAFDFILVDGRQRKTCLIAARDLVKPEGMVICHDAIRPRYHPAFKYYPDSRFLAVKLWRGRTAPIDSAQRLRNRLNFLAYRYGIKRLYRMYRRNWPLVDTLFTRKGWW